MAIDNGFVRPPRIDNTPGRRYVLAEEPEVGDLVPTVWNFKAEWMEFVGQDGLAEWEEAMRTKVGIEIDARMAAKPGCATVSGSPGGWDDCDYWGNGC
ncbi:hypothetical protein [Microbacterium bovistercoris]|nr:hypothetical protein [Microbacterium bovistercoris]